MKPVDVKVNTYIVGDHVRISKYKNIFAKGYSPNCTEKVFVVSKIKNTVLWTYVINDLNGEKIIGTFYEKELRKTNQKEFRTDKVIKRKGGKFYVKWKGYDSSFNSWIDKKNLVWFCLTCFKNTSCFTTIKMSKYFPKPFRSCGRNINVNVYLSNYATKTGFKNISHVDTSSFALKMNLKTEVDKLDINKLVPVPTDLSKLSHVVKKAVVKKAIYDKLVAKVNAIDTSDFVLKTKYDTDKSELENKIPNVTDFVKKAKLTELENKILDISNLATKNTIATVPNKIPNVSKQTKETIQPKLEKFKINLIIIIMTNILLLQNLIL